MLEYSDGSYNHLGDTIGSIALAQAALLHQERSYHTTTLLEEDICAPWPRFSLSMHKGVNGADLPDYPGNRGCRAVMPSRR